ncbi:MAG: PspA/IM30 family protein [Candidatus Bathyarchaeia archaeon]
MGLLAKLRTSIEAKINAILNKTLDPEEVFDLMHETLRGGYNDLVLGLARAKAGQARLKQRRDSIKRLILKRERQAETALKHENEELAKKALQDKIQWQAELEQVDRLMSRQELEIAKLEEARDKAADEIQSFRVNRAAYIARWEAARGRRQIYETLSGVGEKWNGLQASAAAAVDKIEKEEALAEGLEDMAITGTVFDVEIKGTIDRELEELETEASVEEELEKLKKSVEKKE